MDMHKLAHYYHSLGNQFTKQSNVANLQRILNRNPGLLGDIARSQSDARFNRGFFGAIGAIPAFPLGVGSGIGVGKNLLGADSIINKSLLNSAPGSLTETFTTPSGIIGGLGAAALAGGITGSAGGGMINLLNRRLIASQYGLDNRTVRQLMDAYKNNPARFR